MLHTLRRFETGSLATELRELDSSLCLFAPPVKLACPLAFPTPLSPLSDALLAVRGRLARAFHSDAGASSCSPLVRRAVRSDYVYSPIHRRPHVVPSRAPVWRASSPLP